MFFCGIDVAKHTHAVLVLDGAGRVVQPAFSVDNRREAFERLATILAALLEPVVIGMEATGHYWLALYDDLTQRGYAVTVINPLQVAAYRRSGIRKVKTDSSDAFWVADFLRIAAPPPTSRDMPILLQMRELTRFRFWLTDQIGDCKRKILSILDRVFPEYETLFSSVFLTSSRALLKEAATAQEIAAFDLAELTQLLQQSSRGQFGQSKAQAIYNAAQQSVGVGFLVEAVRVEMRCLLQQVDLLQEQITQLDEASAQESLRLFEEMGVLEEEVRLAEALYKERHGDYSAVTLENVALFERQARDIHRTREALGAMDLEQFETVEQFKEAVLASLQKLYDSRAVLRSGVRMLMECVRDMHC